MEKSATTKQMEAGRGISLLDTVFSWSIRDVLNDNLYKNKVNRIPEVFYSTTQYTTSFKAPLLEETRSGLCSGMKSVGQAPAYEVSQIEFSKDHKPPKELYYNILTRKITGFKNPGRHYKPKVGDLVLTKNIKPRKLDDLSRPGQPFVIALVATTEEGSDLTRILASKEIDSELWPSHYTRVKVFATYLMNMTTKMRIWKGLHPDPQGTNMNVILKVLRPKPDVVFTHEFPKSTSNIKSNETQALLVEILKKLADGWREPPLLDSVVVSGVASTMLELYKIDEQLYLAWTLDIQKEKSKHTHVIKVWNVLPAAGIEILAENLNFLFGRYTLDAINRCKLKSFEGTVAVPMTWPVRSVF